MSLAGGDVVTFALTALDRGDITLELVDAQDRAMARGITAGGSETQVIRGFVVPADGTYYVRVSGQPQIEYSLVVTRNADFDSVPNDQIERAPDISSYGAILGAVGGDLSAPSGPDDQTTPVTLPHRLTDGEAFRWEVQWDGSVIDRSSGALDRGLQLGNFYYYITNAFAEDDDREVVLGPQQMYDVQGIELTRKIYVPADQGFVRYLEVVTNTNNTPNQYTVQLNSNLGSDGQTDVAGTSNGDNSFTVDDNWIVTDDVDRRGRPGRHARDRRTGLGSPHAPPVKPATRSRSRTCWTSHPARHGS